MFARLVAGGDGRFGCLVRVWGFAEAEVAGEFEGEILFVDPDFAAVGGAAVFALTQVEGAVAVVAVLDVAGERLAADVAVVRVGWRLAV